MQMRREARDLVDAREVALVVIVVDIRFPCLEPRMGGILADLPEVAHPAGPVGCGGEEVPRGEVVRGGPAVGRFEAFGRGDFGRREFGARRG